MLLWSVYCATALCYISNSKPVILMILTGGLFGYSLLGLGKVLIFRKQDGIFGGLLVLYFLVVLSDIRMNISMYSSLGHLLMIFMLFVSIIICREYGLDFFDKFIMIVFIFCLLGGPILGTYQWITKSFVYNIFENSAQASYNATTYMMFSAIAGNTNYASMHMLLSMFLSILLYCKKQKLVYIIIAIYSALCIVLTFSRATLLAVIVATFILYIFSKKEKKDTLIRLNRHSKLRKHLLLLVFIVVIILVFLSSSIVEMISEYLSNPYALKNLQYKLSSLGSDARFVIWKSLIEKYVSSDLFDLFMGYGSEYTLYFMEGQNITAHNFLLGYMGKSGLLGLTFSFAFVLYSGLLSLRYMKSRDTIARVLGVMLISFLINYMFVADVDYVFISALLVMTAYQPDYGRRDIDNVKTQ